MWSGTRASRSVVFFSIFKAGLRTTAIIAISYIVRYNIHDSMYFYKAEGERLPWKK